MEVETMTESIIEQNKRQALTQAKRDAVIKLLEFRFQDFSEEISKKISSINSISNLDALFEKAAAVQTLDEIDWQNYND